MKRAQPEAALQRAVCQFLKHALDKGVVWLHPANERSNRIEAMRLSRMGVEPGVADLLFLWYEGHGAIELKAPRGYLSQAQKAWRKKYEETGGLYSVCRSVEEVQDTLELWRLPLKASVRAKR